MNYYYNNVPGKGLVRNNLIYTSLINDEKTVFCKWYFNDTDYHSGMNKVTDPEIMENKWNREVTRESLERQQGQDRGERRYSRVWGI